jgi:hypothetical protein
MRQVLAVVALTMVSGCTKSNDITPVIDPPTVVCDGDVTITNSAELDTFVARGCTSVTGTLSIVGTDLTSVNLPALTMANSLEISGNNALASVNLPVLVEVPTTRTGFCGYLPSGCRSSGGIGLLGNPSLVSLSMPALVKAGSFEARGSALTSLSLPSLRTVEGACWSINMNTSTGMEVMENPALAEVSLPRLTDAVCLNIDRNAVLRSLDMPALTAGGVGVSGTAITSLSLPALGSATWLEFSGNTSLVSVSAPALTTIDYLGVSDNAYLTSLSLPALTAAGNLTITGNTAYPQCAAEAMVAHLVNFNGTATISGNNTTATCVVCEGDVTITNAAEMDAFVARGCASVTGTLIIAGTDLTDVSLPGLVSAGGLEISSNPHLARMNLPTLATVTNNALHPYCLFTPVNSRGLVVADNPVLTAVEVPSLREAGSIYLGALPVVTLDMPALTKVESFVAENNPALTSLNLPALSAATGRSGGYFCKGVAWGWLGGLWIQGNPSLGSILLPSLANAEEAGVRNNGSLLHLALPSLRQCATAFTVVDNGILRQCEAEAILAQLTATPATVTISGNDTAATCSPVAVAGRLRAP